MRKRLMSAVGIATALTFSVMPGVALAVPAPVTDVELNVPTSDFVAVDASFNPSDSARLGMPALRQLRAEMWEINPPIDGQPLRQLAAKSGLTSKEAYVNAVKGNGNLTIIGIQRAVEASYLFAHQRPFTANCEIASCLPEETALVANTGVSSWGQNLAANSRGDLTSAILEQWGHGELQALKDANGYFNTGNGHLRWLLFPDVREIGFGAVFVDGIGYFTSAHGPIFGGNTLPYRADSFPNRAYTTRLYRSADGSESPTGVRPLTVAEDTQTVVPLRLGGFTNATTVTATASSDLVEASVDSITGELLLRVGVVEEDTPVEVTTAVEYANGATENITTHLVVGDRPASLGDLTGLGPTSSSSGGSEMSPQEIIGLIVGIISLIGSLLSAARAAGLL
ncbi:MAG: hypothetical protein SPI77_09245 [Corynebacterium sp.]|nr:hypothetical protein [Corynebacterium sp.]